MIKSPGRRADSEHQGAPEESDAWRQRSLAQEWPNLQTAETTLVLKCYKEAGAAADGLPNPQKRKKWNKFMTDSLFNIISLSSVGQIAKFTRPQMAPGSLFAQLALKAFV